MRGKGNSCRTPYLNKLISRWMNGEETEAGKEESMKKKRVRLKETEIHAAFQGYQMVKL